MQTILLLLLLLVAAAAAGPATASASGPASGDWLVSPPDMCRHDHRDNGGRRALTMANGLIARTLLIEPNWVTWSLLSGGDDLLRSVQPEASFMVENRTFMVGGVAGTSNYAFKNVSDPLAASPGVHGVGVRRGNYPCLIEALPLPHEAGPGRKSAGSALYTVFPTKVSSGLPYR
eukprot:SAG11_NODE_2451_length_3346_cov_3.959347_1_plen_175_part_00